MEPEKKTDEDDSEVHAPGGVDETRISAELVFGLISPVGSDVGKVTDALTTALESADYEVVTLRLSELFQEIDEDTKTENKYDRIWASMNAGDRLRRISESPAIMAQQAVARIHTIRKQVPGSQIRRRAFILRSLKRPEEVQYLRTLYGPRFVLVSIFSHREQRIASLRRREAMSEAEAVKLVTRDEGDGTKHGQATRNAFELADLFVDGDSNAIDQVVIRFVDLILGSPLYTPQREEHAMFLAFATSLRSADLSRQVGAVVTTREGILLAEGCNDAPAFGGVAHWPGTDDKRDLSLGYDTNKKVKERIASRILSAALSDEERIRIENAISMSGLNDITEFGRAVHAEMAALMTCARQGTSVQGATLFSTTFPCHNCAKHIIAAGIHEVVFVEPYPKSKALELYDNELTMSDCSNKILMKPFVGVGPRRYQQLFALRGPYGERIIRESSGNVLKWDRRKAAPAFHDRLTSTRCSNGHCRSTRRKSDLAGMDPGR